MVTEEMRRVRETIAQAVLDENVPTQVTAGLVDHINAMLDPLNGSPETIGWTVLAVANTIMGSAYTAAALGDTEPACLLRGYAIVLGGLANRILTDAELADLDAEFPAGVDDDLSDGR